MIRLMIVTMFAVVLGVATVGLPTLSGLAAGLFLLSLFLLEWFYGAFFEWLMSGRTPGKAVVSLRVVREDGAPATLPDLVLRNLLRGVDYLPGLFGVALASMLLDRKLRRVGDLVAGTVVVIEERERVSSRIDVSPPVTEEERQAMPARVDLSRDELEAIEAFLRRRPRLSPERAEELAGLFAPTLAARSGLESHRWERVLALAYARATGKDRA